VTDDADRVRLGLPAGGRGSVTVVGERVFSNSLAVTDMSLDTLLAYERSNRVSREVANAVRRAASIRDAEAELTRERSALISSRSRLVRDQERARENLASFDQGSEGRQRFVQKLLEAESEIERVDARMATLDREIAAKNRELRDFLNGLNLR